MLRLFLSLILAVSFFGSFSAKAETELWGDFSGVTLRVKLIGGGQYEGLYNEVIPWWEENTGGKIEIVTQKNHFELDKEIKKDIASGNLDFCVASNHTSFASQYGNIYTDLNSIMPASVLADYTPLILEHSTVDGRLVQMPRHSDVSNLYYQKSLYEDADNKANFKAKYGYDLTPPETWDQVKDQAIFFSNPPDFYGTQYVGKEEAIAGRFYELVIANGGALFDEDYRPIFNSPAGVEALQWFIDLYNAKAVPDGVLNYLWDDTGLGFASGTIAMNLDWAGWAGFFNDPENSKVAGDIGLVRAPMGSGGLRTGWSGSHSFSMTESCPDKEAAASFLWALTSNKAQMIEARGGLSPTRPAIWDAIIAEKKAEGDEFMLMVFETFKMSLAEDAFTPPLIPEWIEFTNALYPELQAAILGDKSPEDALATASKKATEIMEDAGYF